MIVQVITYRAKPGEEDAIVALHEDWQRQLVHKASGYVSGELLSDPDDPRSFIEIARYACRGDCDTTAADPDQEAWYRRVCHLVEAEPVIRHCRSEWQVELGRATYEQVGSLGS